MIIPDANLVIYAYDSRSPHHEKAARWWEETLSSQEPVGLLDIVVFAFVRITTNPRLFSKPLEIADASSVVRSWLERTQVQLLRPPDGYVEKVLSSLELLATAGNLVTDAQIAASTIAYNAVLHTADFDFLRFPKLKWFNPLTGHSSARIRAER